MFELNDKVVAVTGAGSGIGRSIAETFARQGAHVYILEFDSESGESVASAIRETGAKAVCIEVDVGEQSQAEAAIERVAEEAGSLDILINNAGVSHIGTVVQSSEEDMDRLYRVNVKGVYNCVKVSIPHMLRAGGGVILNMASVASTLGIPERFAYSMSKGAVLTMTLSVATDYVSHNIRCNCICPARVHTPFVDDYLRKNYPGHEQEMFDKLAKTAPIGRMVQPKEVAALGVYLCSDEAAACTGGVYYIDGGMTLLR